MERVTITEDGFRNPMKMNYFFYKEFSNLSSSVGMLQQDEMAIFGEAINNHQNSVVAAGLGKSEIKSRETCSQLILKSVKDWVSMCWTYSIERWYNLK